MQKMADAQPVTQTINQAAIDPTKAAVQAMAVAGVEASISKEAGK